MVKKSPEFYMTNLFIAFEDVPFDSETARITKKKRTYKNVLKV